MRSRQIVGILLVFLCFSAIVKAQQFLRYGEYGTEGYDVEASPQGDTFVAGLEWVGKGDGTAQDVNGWLGHFDRFKVLKSSAVIANGEFKKIVRDNGGNLFVLGNTHSSLAGSEGFLLAKFDSSLRLIKFINSSVKGLSQSSHDSVDFTFSPDGDLLVLLTEYDASSRTRMSLAEISSDLEVKNTVTSQGPEGSNSWGIALAVDGQGNSLAVMEETVSGVNSIVLMKYDASLQLTHSKTIRTSTPDDAFYVNAALSDKDGNWVLAGHNVSAGPQIDRRVWLGSWRNDLSDLAFETFVPSTGEIYPKGLTWGEGGRELFLSGALFQWERDEFGFDTLSQKGWVGTFSATFVLTSSKTFSGSHPGGANFAGGMVWKNGGLYVTGAVTNPGRTTVYLESANVQDPFNLPLPNDQGEAFIYPNPFLPQRGHGNVFFRNVPESSQVRVFTMSGKKVKELIIRSQNEGWDVRSDQTEPLASGVYFVRIQGSGVEKTIKFLVQR